MKLLRYVSDLHLEMKKTINIPKLLPLWDFDAGKDEYYLVLLGDICNPYHPHLTDFLIKVSAKYQEIFYVPGNHEYYNIHSDICYTKSQIDNRLENLCKQFPNIHLLNNKCYKLGKIKFIGTTLWSKIKPENIAHIREVINDYHLIFKQTDEPTMKLVPITTDDTHQWNQDAIQFLEQEITSEYQCIVLTHHAPLYSDASSNLFTAPKFYLNGRNNDAFHNDLRYLFKPPIIAWFYGHTHYVGETEFNGVKLITNQLGYNGEKCGFAFDATRMYDLTPHI